MTAPAPGPQGPDSNARGIAVLVVAVLVGLVLLFNADGGSSEAVSSSGPTTTVDVSGLSSTTEYGSDTTTTTRPDTSGKDPSEIDVLVLNGTKVGGVAASNSETIGAKGYNMLKPGDAATNTSTTTVYFKADYEADASSIAALLGRSPNAVQAMPSDSLGPGSADADIVVVIGSDIANATSGSGSSGSSTSSTSTTSPN